MVQWTYQVIVKSESGRNVSEAINDLTTSQERAAKTFSDISTFISGDFRESIVTALDERLSHWMEDDEEGASITDNFQKLHTSLLEIQAGLITLLDLKEGDLTSTINTLNTLMAAMEGSERTFETGVVEMFKEISGGMEQIERKTASYTRASFEKLIPRLGEIKEGSYLSYNEETKEFGLNDKFITAAMGKFEDVLSDYPNFLAKETIKELGAFFDNISKTSGKTLLETFVPEEDPNMPGLKPLKVIQDIINSFQKKKALLEKWKKEGKMEGKEGLAADVAKGDPFHRVGMANLEGIKDLFKKGLTEAIKEKGSDLLKDPSTLEIINDIFVENMFERVHELLIERFAKNPKRPPLFSKAVQTARKDQDVYDAKSFGEDILQYMYQGDDPFNLTELKEKLTSLLVLSNAEFKEADDDTLLRTIIEKNLGEEVGIPDSIKKSLSEYLVNHLDDVAEDVFLSAEKAFATVKNILDRILAMEKLPQTLDEAVEIFDDFYSGLVKDDDSIVEKSTSGHRQNTVIDLESMLIDNFKESKDKLWDVQNYLGNLIFQNFLKLEEVWGDIGGSLSLLLTALSSIELPEKLAAHSSDFYG